MKRWQKSRNWDIFGFDKKDTERSKYWKYDILLSNGFDTKKSIIDVGCADMFFWGNLTLKNFIGIDRDFQQIIQNRKEYPNYTFYCEEPMKHIEDISADIVICFDWLNHIKSELDYMESISHLVEYSKDKLFIYAWYKNPFKSFINRCIIKRPLSWNVTTDNKYQYYRNFDEYSDFLIEKFFILRNKYTNKRWPYGAMYYYERK